MVQSFKSGESTCHASGRPICESRKHKVAYIGPILLFIIGLPILFAPRYYYIVGVLFILGAVNSYLLNRSVRWTLYADRLVIKRGYLLWKKMFYSVPAAQIFESYFDNGLIGHYIGYGNIHIRRTEGSTTRFSQFIMTNHRNMVGEINTLVHSRSQQSGVTLINVDSQAKNIERLARLREQGLLSEEEFNLKRQQVLGI